MIVYRAVDSVPPPLEQEPQQFVRHRAEWRAISEACNPPARAAAFARLRSERSWAYKCMVEWAYEVVRLKEAVGAPSRLDSLFLFADRVDAISFAKRFNKVAVYEGSPVYPDIRVGQYDFGLYYTRADTFEPTAEVFGEAWVTACTMASRYWRGEVATGPVETLVGGTVMLTREPIWTADRAS